MRTHWIAFWQASREEYFSLQTTISPLPPTSRTPLDLAIDRFDESLDHASCTHIRPPCPRAKMSGCGPRDGSMLRHRSDPQQAVVQPIVVLSRQLRTDGVRSVVDAYRDTTRYLPRSTHPGQEGSLRFGGDVGPSGPLEAAGRPSTRRITWAPRRPRVSARGVHR